MTPYLLAAHEHLPNLSDLLRLALAECARTLDHRQSVFPATRRHRSQASLCTGGGCISTSRVSPQQTKQTLTCENHIEGV
jgi:hypothetical protein